MENRPALLNPKITSKERAELRQELKRIDIILSNAWGTGNAQKIVDFRYLRDECRQRLSLR